MAKLSGDRKYVTVEKGDTLGQISIDYFDGYSNYKQLAALNNIPNPNLIYIGQLIWFIKPPSSSSSNKNTASNAPVIDHFGLQSNSDNTLFAMWTWNKSNTESYQVKWEYQTKDGIWFVGSSSANSVDEHDPAASRQSTYSIPSNATKVRFKVKPISKKRTVNERQVSYWTANWSTEKVYDVGDLPPAAPTGLSVKIEELRLTAELTNLDSLEATEIEFQIVRNNSRVYDTIKVPIKTGYASCICTVTTASVYKVRCRAIRNDVYGAWSEYSSNIATVPGTPPAISVCKAFTKESVYLSWDFGLIFESDYCEIEYTTDEKYFDSSNETTTVSPVKVGYYYVLGLETGQRYFFRIRVVNSAGESGWSEPVSVVIGTPPAAPTTWSSTTTAIIGEPVTLFWVHNSEDGSKQTLANLEVYIDGELQLSKIFTYPETEDEEDENVTGSYVLETKELTAGAEIHWRVQTAGILEEVGDWSIERIIDVYAQPTVELGLSMVEEGVLVDTIKQFPFYISAIPYPAEQFPLSYHIYIIANESYQTIDQIGNTKFVNNGETIYSKVFYNDASKLGDRNLLIEMSPGNIDLENNIPYTVGCTVSMDSGLTAEAKHNFVVNWIENFYEPNAEISIDPETYTANIRPYCERDNVYTVKVSKNDSGEYEIDSPQVVLEYVYGARMVVDGSSVSTITGEAVFEGTDGDGNQVMFATVHERIMLENSTLSVYRREYDGSFIELATGLDNSKNTFVTDPHPALDYARYRIVAIKNDTGAVGYYDVPGYPVNCHAILIQWDEDWSNFDISSEDPLAIPPWTGSMLKLPYNIDKSTNYNPDVSLIEYVGREHPVSYYGTQIGEAETWNVEIPATDIETRYALRRLAKWMGDVYVREPSGSGYWAKITVSYSEKHKGVTIPVTFDITRVEGGA